MTAANPVVCTFTVPGPPEGWLRAIPDGRGTDARQGAATVAGWIARGLSLRSGLGHVVGRFHGRLVPHPKTEVYKERILSQYLAICDFRPHRHEGEVDLEIVAVYPVPASWPKWKAEQARAGLRRPTSKPDADNIAKSVMDALGKKKGRSTAMYAYLDDAQVCRLLVVPRYSHGDRDPPRIEVSLAFFPQPARP